MGQPAVAIPEKIFFKIGEVCDIVDVQAHVLRYWETEFPMLAPQKNRAGQRTYRRRDVEIAVRIKELLYEELYTIAGAKKKLLSELRGEAPKLKIVSTEPQKNPPQNDFEQKDESKKNFQTFTPPGNLKTFVPESDFVENETGVREFEGEEITSQRRAALLTLTQQLGELRQILETEEDVPRRGW